MGASAPLFMTNTVQMEENMSGKFSDKWNPEWDLLSLCYNKMLWLGWNIKHHPRHLSIDSYVFDNLPDTQLELVREDLAEILNPIVRALVEIRRVEHKIIIYVRSKPPANQVLGV